MRLSDCFMEIIAYTTYVAAATSAGQPTFEQVQGTIKRLIAQSEGCLQQNQFPHEDYQLARFAVFAWVDETFLASQWEGRHQWQREQLQRLYYQTADAGELFFEKLNAIGPHQRDAREVYYLCLSLGFTGQYCHEGDDFMLEQLRLSNLKVLTGSSMGVPTLENEQLFPQAYPMGDHDVAALPKKQPWSKFAIMCAVSPIVLYGLLYVIYLFILGNIGDNLIGTVPK
ncbi:MAG: DotU family type IV/VI secretion system protein [Desulfobacteraceae bacterium]